MRNAHARTDLSADISGSRAAATVDRRDRDFPVQIWLNYREADHPNTNRKRCAVYHDVALDRRITIG
jgi:hypothetical protein